MSTKETEIEMVLKAYRSMRGLCSYISMPITGGPNLYDELEHRGVSSLKELHSRTAKSLRNRVISENKSRSERAETRVATHAKYSIVNPGLFEADARKWTEHDYMDLWLKLINEKAKEMFMVRGWTYSSGASQEFALATEIANGKVRPTNGLHIYEAPGYYDLEPVQIDAMSGALKMANSIKDLLVRGFTAEKLLPSFYSVAEYAIGTETEHEQLESAITDLDRLVRKVS